MKNTNKKHIVKFTLLLLLGFILVSCSSSQEEAEKKVENTHIVGMWDTGKDIYNFYEDGRFETVNKIAIAGYSWRIEEDKLILSFLDSPANQPKEEVYLFETVRTARLILLDKDGEKVTWNRSHANVNTAKAKLFYRERIALPPEVIVYYQLTQNEGKNILNSAYYSAKGSIPLAFNAHYLSKNYDKNLPVELFVTLYYKDNALFSTKEYIQLDASQEQEILLMRVTNEENSPTKLNAPQSFTFTKDAQDALYTATLFLEDKNLFFLIQDRDEKNDGIDEKESYITWGYWNQIGRGHSIELIVSGKETLTGAVNKESKIFFDRLYLFDAVDNIEFIPSDKKMDEKIYFNLKGNAVKKDNAFYFKPAGLTENFKLLGNVLVSPILNELANNESIYLEVNAAYSNDGFFDVQNIISTAEAKNEEDKAAHVDLTNTYWRLTELNNKEDLISAPAESHFILNIEEENTKSGKGAGSDGCNSFFFTWNTPNKNKLDIILGGSTMRLCHEEGLEAQGRDFLQVLDKADSYIIHGSSLELKQGDKKLAKFESVAL